MDCVRYAMEAGRELDRLVAEKVMGWTDLWEGEGYVMAYPPNEQAMGIDGERAPVPPYSTDIAAAWQVVERMTDRDRADRCTFEMHRATDWDDPAWGYDVRFGRWGDPTHQRERKVWARTAPLAISLAALKALDACGMIEAQGANK
jgi:hypothetical protein